MVMASAFLHLVHEHVAYLLLIRTPCSIISPRVIPEYTHSCWYTSCRNHRCADLSQEMSAGDVAQRAVVSLYYMLHQFKRATSITISDYRNELRLTQAKRLLVSGTQSMTEIAHACGFGAPSDVN